MDSIDAILVDAILLLKEWDRQYWNENGIGSYVMNPDIVALESRLKDISEGRK